MPTIELTVHQIPLTELEHIPTCTHGIKLRNSEHRNRSSVSTMPPIWLSKTSPEAPFRLEDGNHRLTVARALELASVPAIVSTGAAEFAAHSEAYRFGFIGLKQEPHLDRLRAEAAKREERLRSWLGESPAIAPTPGLLTPG